MPYPPPDTSFIMKKSSDSYIQNQRKSAYDSSMGAHDLASAGFDQSTNHHGNNDVRDNDDSH